jgi:WD40 repeat protein
MTLELQPFNDLQSPVMPSFVGSIIPEKAQLTQLGDVSFDASFRRVLCVTRLSTPITRYDEDGEPYEEPETSSALILWDTTTGAELRRFAEANDGIQVCALSPDGRLALSGGREEPLRLWDAASGECLHTFTELEGPAYNGHFIDDGRLFAVQDIRQVWLFDTAQRTPIRSLPLKTKIAFSPSGLSFLAYTGYVPCTFTAYNTLTGEEHGQFTLPHGLHLYYAVSDNGQVALVVSLPSLQGTAEIWDMAAGQRAVELSGPVGFPRHCALSPDGNFALIASDEGAHLWDVATGECRLRLPEPARLPMRCAFSVDGARLALVGHDGTLVLYETATLRPSEQHTALVATLAFTPDGQTLISASEDRTLRVWDVATRQLKRVLTGHQGHITAVAINPEGTICASASGDQTLRLWDIETGGCFHILTGHTNTVSACAFSPDGRTLLSAGYDELLLEWECDTGRLKNAYIPATRPSLYTSCAYSPEGRQIVASTSSAISQWERASPLPRHTWTERDAGDLQFTADGRHLLLGMKRQIIDVASGAVVMTFTGMQAEPRNGILSQDETLVIAVNAIEKLVCIWGRTSGELLAQWEALVSLASCAIHPQNNLVVVGGWNGTVQWLRLAELQ